MKKTCAAGMKRRRNVHNSIRRYRMLIRIPKGWEIPGGDATPEAVFLNRRSLLKAAGFFGMEGLLAAAKEESPYPAKRNPEFTLDRPITEE
jgi:sulfoxide reductase catalytic subunit YedY